MTLRIVHTESSINMGGQELRVLNQVRWLRDHGHTSWLLARRDSAIYQEGLRMGLPVHALPFRGSMHPGTVIGLIRFLVKHRVDLIDCHSSRDASAALAARLLLGIPVVRTQHVCKRLKDDVFHRLVWTRGNDRLIGLSESVAARLVAQGLSSPEHVETIGTAVDLTRFTPEVDGQAVRRTFGVPPGAKVVSVIGMIRPDKAQRYLVRAVDGIVARIPQAFFLIVGSPTRPEYLSQLQEEIARVHHRERIILTGFQRAVEQCIAASDVVAVTSRIEARSQVIPQAFAMRRIVVASDVGGIPELVRDGETGFLYPVGDADQLTECVITALTTDVSSQVESAYRLAQARLGFDSMMAATLQAYRKVLRR